MAQIERLLGILPTAPIARQAWEKHGAVVVEGKAEMVQVADRIASGHVQVMMRDPDYSEFGFGAVIATLPGFLVLRSGLNVIPSPLVNATISTTILAASPAPHPVGRASRSPR